MKVFIITNGGEGIGYGHMTRCLGLGEVFRKRRVEPEFIANDDPVVKGLLKNYSLRLYRPDQSFADVYRYSQGADVCVVDSYQWSHQECENLASVCKVFSVFDDIGQITYPSGIVINAAIDAVNFDYPKKTGVDYLLGVPYAVLRQEFFPQHKRDINADINSVLVTFGGMDFSFLISEVLKILMEMNSSLVVHVVSNFWRKDLQKDVSFDPTAVHCHEGLNAMEMAALMRQVDLAVSACGQTTYELAFTGTPTIGVQAADNQKAIAAGWQKAGFLAFGGSHDAADLDSLIRHCYELLAGQEARRKVSEIGRQLVDGLGAQRIVERILERMSV